MRDYRALTLGLVLLLAVGGTVTCLLMRRDSVSDASLEASIDASLQHAEQMRIRLLRDTDHHALLKAGREVLSQVAPRPFEIAGTGYFPISADVPVPEVIRSLRPHAVLVASAGYLIVEMHGGMDHFGVYVYPEGHHAGAANDHCGDRKLTEGLWYYDDGYLHNPDYDRRIDALVKEGSVPM